MTQRIPWAKIQDDVVPEPRRFTATLLLPPSINRTYHSGLTRDGKSVFYMDGAAKEWKKDAGLLLSFAGWRRLPDGDYSLTLEYTIYCAANRDIESISKILTDVATAAIGVDDRHITTLHIEKVVAHKAAHHVEIRLTAFPR